MKILTVIGTRPEIIRLSLVIPLLDRASDHILVHTGQNFHERLTDIFFRELRVRAPDRYLGVRAERFGEQLGGILSEIEPVLRDERPDRVLILGDTNSGLVALVARRLGIPVYHMEAGNRCFDDRVPEEVNRRVIDHASSVLLPYTNRSRDNLLHEGIHSSRIYVSGNPIKQVIDHYAVEIEASRIIEELGLREREYFLVTMHRSENVDSRSRLCDLLTALDTLAAEYSWPVICSVHPRTRARLVEFGLTPASHSVHLAEPFGLFDFIRLERSAGCLLSDSGTVQEEACLFGVPNVTIREVTERPETVECGSNIIAGTDRDRILAAVQLVTAQQGQWMPPPEYLQPAVAETVVRIITGYRVPDPAELEWNARRDAAAAVDR